jgi:hypothetical protein
MSYNTNFYTLSVEELRGIIGSKRKDVKEELIQETATYMDPADTIVPSPGETEEETKAYIERARERDKAAALKEQERIARVIDEGIIDEAEAYPGTLLDFVEHKDVEVYMTFQAYWDLIELLVKNPEIPQDLTDLLSYITEGRRVTDGERFHSASQTDTFFGYWTVDEIKKLATLLPEAKKVELGELSEAVDALTKVVEAAQASQKDVVFTSG